MSEIQELLNKRNTAGAMQSLNEMNARLYEAAKIIQEQQIMIGQLATQVNQLENKVNAFFALSRGHGPSVR